MICPVCRTDILHPYSEGRGADAVWLIEHLATDHLWSWCRWGGSGYICPCGLGCTSRLALAQHLVEAGDLVQHFCAGVIMGSAGVRR